MDFSTKPIGSQAEPLASPPAQIVGAPAIGLGASQVGASPQQQLAAQIQLQSNIQLQHTLQMNIPGSGTATIAGAQVRFVLWELFQGINLETWLEHTSWVDASVC